MVTSIKGNDTSTFGGQVVTPAPAFSAYMSTASQSVSSATTTKVALDAETFDTNNCYDTTNYRFTPNVAGYYQVNGTVRCDGTSKTLCQASIWKNGSVYHYGNDYKSTDSTAIRVNASVVLYLNGTTDYIELYGRTDGSSLSFAGTNNLNSHFSAVLVRAV